MESLGLLATQERCQWLDKLQRRLKVHAVVKLGVLGAAPHACRLEELPEDRRTFLERDAAVTPTVNSGLARYGYRVVGECERRDSTITHSVKRYAWCRLRQLPPLCHPQN